MSNFERWRSSTPFYGKTIRVKKKRSPQAFLIANAPAGLIPNQ